jgi:hypothetical protein
MELQKLLSIHKNSNFALSLLLLFHQEVLFKFFFNNIFIKKGNQF